MSQDWITRAEAFQEFPTLTNGMLNKWRRTRCPYLKGKRRVGAKRNPRNRAGFLYSRKDLQTAIDSQTAVTHKLRDPNSAWIWADEAEAILSMDRSMLSRYMHVGCAALGGRRLTVRAVEVPDGWGKKIHFPRYQYLRADVERIAGTRGESTQVYEDESGRWLASPLALKTYRIHKDKLGRLGKRGAVKRKWLVARTSDGTKLRGMFFYLEKDLEQLPGPDKAWPYRGKMPAEWASELAPGWPMAKEAAALLGVNASQIGHWALKGCAYLPGRKKLGSRRLQIPGRRRKLVVYSPIDLSEIKSRRDAAVGADRDQVTHDEAERDYGFSRAQLAKWRKACPFLEGRKPLAVQTETRWLGGEANEARSVFVFSRSDLEKIHQRMNESEGWLLATVAVTQYQLTEEALAGLWKSGEVRRKSRVTWDAETRSHRPALFYSRNDLERIRGVSDPKRGAAHVAAAEPPEERSESTAGDGGLSHTLDRLTREALQHFNREDNPGELSAPKKVMLVSLYWRESLKLTVPQIRDKLRSDIPRGECSPPPTGRPGTDRVKKALKRAAQFLGR